ncbi:MAG: cupredoxin domain-containing protein [Armatimonadetes bacterium]|nr:cupredoxin domain-containing protein [Armatimonadota bacterium]
MKRVNATYIALLFVVGQVLPLLSTPAIAQHPEQCSGCANCEMQTAPRAKKSGQVQQATIVIEERQFNPADIVVEPNVPVELTFNRNGFWECSDQVFIPDLRVRKSLETGQKVTVKFTPTKLGVIPFTCGTGRLKGKILVETPDANTLTRDLSCTGGLQ